MEQLAIYEKYFVKSSYEKWLERESLHYYSSKQLGKGSCSKTYCMKNAEII